MKTAGVFEMRAKGDQPWMASPHSYAGWLPNVTGQLSFKLVDPSGEFPAFNQQRTPEEPRVVVVHQRNRLAQDFPLPDFVVRKVRRRAQQSFLFIARSGATIAPYFEDDRLHELDDEHGLLVGKIVVVPEHDKLKPRWQRHQLLAKIDRRIQDWVDAEGGYDGDPLGELSSILQEADELVTRYELNVVLFRTGEVRIWFDLDDLLSRDTTQSPLTEAEEILRDGLPAQAYYFLKDIFHKHYHHEKHQDQYIRLTRLEATDDVDDDNPHGYVDDVSWRYSTLRGLVRTVVERRQSGKAKAHKEAMGIIAYARAFQNTLARIQRRSPSSQPRPILSRMFGSEAPVFRKSAPKLLYDFTTLEASIDAVDASIQAANQPRLQAYAVVFAVCLSAIAIWIGSVQIRPILCEAVGTPTSCTTGTSTGVEAVNFLATHPISFFLAVYILTVGYFVIKFRDTGAFPAFAGLVRWVEELHQMFMVSMSRFIRRHDRIAMLVSNLILVALIAGVATLAWVLLPEPARSSMLEMVTDLRRTGS